MNSKSRNISAVFLSAIIIALAVVVLLTHLEQKRRDTAYTKSELIPLAEKVLSMKSHLGRLPTIEEFRAWADVEHENKLIDYYPEKPDFMKSWGKDGEDFVVGKWRGEWIHYYSSWDGDNFSK